MSVNGMSVGSDFTFGLYDANTGTILDLGMIENVKISAQKHDIKGAPYNGLPMFGYIPDGYKGTFQVTRTSSKMEDLQITLNAAFQNGSIVKPGFLNEVITNPDGTVSRYQYTNAVFFMTELSDVSRDKVIKQTVEFMASNKVSVS